MKFKCKYFEGFIFKIFRIIKLLFHLEFEENKRRDNYIESLLKKFPFKNVCYFKNSIKSFTISCIFNIFYIKIKNLKVKI